MKTIYKYQLQQGTGVQSVQLPVGAEIISAQIQHGANFCLWAKVDTLALLETRKILIVGTGWELPEGNLQFLGTVQDGPFVWHAFEVLP